MARGIRTNCVTTLVDDYTGEFKGYRLSLPITSEVADQIKAEEKLHVGRNGVIYFIYETTDFKELTGVKLNIQLVANGCKIAALQRRHVNLQSDLANL